MMEISVKRVYERAEKKDGTRILVDRLWPRGVRKDDANIDRWEKDVAPSSALRSWFHADPEARYREFAARYRTELSNNGAFKRLRSELQSHRRATLVTAAKDVAHSHVPVLRARLAAQSRT